MAILKELYFNDGEALDYADLNNLQRYMTAKVQDLVMGERRNIGGSGGLSTATDLLWTPSLDCYPYQHATAMHISNKAGLILQSTGTVTGTTPMVQMYALAADELDTTITAAHATLDRTDSIFVLLSEAAGSAETRDFSTTGGVLSSQSLNKKLNTVCTKSYVTGTPAAAGTSVAPATPANYARLCDILVPAAATGVLAANLVDHLLPMTSKTIDAACFSPEWYAFTGGGWTRTAQGLWTSAGAGNLLHLYLRANQHHGARLIGARLYAQLQAGSAVRIRTKQLNTFGTPSIALNETITPSLPLAGQATLAPAAGSWSATFTPGGTKPFWLNGTNAGRATFNIGTDATASGTTYLEIEAGGAGDIVSWARVFVMGF